MTAYYKLNGKISGWGGFPLFRFTDGEADAFIGVGRMVDGLHDLGELVGAMDLGKADCCEEFCR